ncbi:uncharacterized protein BXZ73DRAFT_107513 [Epithele typhae]|uniref:uncharacterized protein n=1 Tax=Epithele typhae TaxID=378194 RepID=UPI0020073D24|nr:uncharacterized protein BXZ73DRAFT_107513 [Epithele typhae]KAH9912312.1 hypothetical protein BXZ73DRAFT_107513 [Epithele typhae]
MLFALLVVLVAVLGDCQAREVNRTIDDYYGDSVTGVVPIYKPTAEWADGNTCDACYVNSSNVDISKVFKGTWHDSTWYPVNTGERSITLTFNGTAVWVYMILANQIQSTSTTTNLAFSLDEIPRGKFMHPPDKTNDVLYQQLVFEKTGLALQTHSLEITGTGNEASLMLFDNVVYTAFEADYPTDNPYPTLGSNLPLSSSATAQGSLSDASGPPTHTTTVTAHSINSVVTTSHPDILPTASVMTVSTTSLPQNATVSGTQLPSSNRSATIAGSVCGGIALLISGIVLTLLYTRRIRARTIAVTFPPGTGYGSESIPDRVFEETYNGSLSPTSSKVYGFNKKLV